MNAKQQLDALQFNQLDHDKLFHPDIHQLPTQKRVAHMVLHFAKYSGKFTLAKQNKDRGLLITNIIDTFIISMVLANTFNKRISDFDEIYKFAEKASINDLAKQLKPSDNVSKESIYNFISENLAIQAGKMAKAIESLDHFENYSYVDELIHSLQKIVITVLVGVFYLSIDLPKQIQIRLDAVERKSIFYTQHRSINSISQTN